MRSWHHIAFWAIAAVLVIGRAAAVFTENVNWDELALLHRAEATLRTGQLVSGGRPGLGTLALAPFAAGCRDAVHALVQARVLWTGIVFGSVVAFWFLLRAVLPPTRHRWTALVTGVGLWVLAPAFLRFSIQVRTDQPAILLGLLGGLALLASRRNVYWSLAAGVLMATGFLFSQKLLYVAGLVGALAAGQLYINNDWRWRREATRVALAIAGFLTLALTYRLASALFGRPPALMPVAGAIREFDFYRQVFGWYFYHRMLPTVVPQLLVLAGLLAVTLMWIRSRGRHTAELATAWSVAILGLAVILLHAGRFPYFYMVLGLFPATIGALITGPVLDRVGSRALRAGLIAIVWLPLALMGLGQTALLTIDTQQVQRESLAFVERNFNTSARGFQNHGAFVCRADDDHFPVRFPQHIAREFDGADADENTRRLIQQFRDRPVSFLVLPQDPFPAEVFDFWTTRYVHYYAAVHVPGRDLTGGPGAADTFEVIVPGTYVWRATSPDSGPLEVDGALLDPGDTVVIDRPGNHDLSLPLGGTGMFVLNLTDSPAPDSRRFYRNW